MFGTHGVARIVWNQMEEDFVLGACPHRIIGFATLSADGQWGAFDGDSAPIAWFGALEDAKSALRDAHRGDHARECESHSSLPVWDKFKGFIAHGTK